MKSVSPIHYVNVPVFCFQAVGVALAIIYIGVHLQSKSYANLGFSIVFLSGAFSLLLDKRHDIKIGSPLKPCLLGLLILIGILVLITLYPRQKILGFAPFVGAFGMALLASGFSGLKQYLRELLILFIYGTSKVVPSFLPDISPITAKFSSYILWYAGFNPTLEGSYLAIPNGGIVDVAPACSGLYLMTYMLALSALILVMFPTIRRQRIVLPFISIALGFITNGIRVAILTYLSAPSFPHAFDYWHSDEGSFVFNIIPVLILGLYCMRFMDSSSDPKPSQSPSQSPSQ